MMTIALTNFLISAVEISHVFSVLTILVCLVGMTFFIIRLHSGDFMSNLSVKYVQQQPKDLLFNKVLIPFSVSVVIGSEKHHQGLKCCLRSDIPCSVTAYWGVKVKDLQNIVFSDWPCKTVQLEGICHFELSEVVYSSENYNNDTHLNLVLPETPFLHLGKAPRTVYPLVLVISSKIKNETDFLGLISVFHIKDNECDIPSCIVGQFLVDKFSRTLNLQKLFTNGNITYPQNEKCEICKKEPVNAGNQEESNLCMICQQNTITTALLPCKHVLCHECYIKVDRCPMCRSAIAAYFKLNAQ